MAVILVFILLFSIWEEVIDKNIFDYDIYRKISLVNVFVIELGSLGSFAGIFSLHSAVCLWVFIFLLLFSVFNLKQFF